MMDGETSFGVRVAKESFNFSVAHFLIFDAARREELHGHNYRVSVSLDGIIGDDGVVLDFLVLKPILTSICQEIDHRTVFPARSRHLSIERHGGSVEVRFGGERFLFPENDVVLLPIDNTSTEHFAHWVSDRLVAELVERGLLFRIHRLEVDVSESPGQSAFFIRRFGPIDA